MNKRKFVIAVKSTNVSKLQSTEQEIARIESEIAKTQKTKFDLEAGLNAVSGESDANVSGQGKSGANQRETVKASVKTRKVERPSDEIQDSVFEYSKELIQSMDSLAVKSKCVALVKAMLTLRNETWSLAHRSAIEFHLKEVGLWPSS